MPAILLDAFLLQLKVPADRPDAEIAAARRILGRKSFQRELKRAAETVFRRHPELARLVLTLSR